MLAEAALLTYLSTVPKTENKWEEIDEQKSQ